MDNNKRSSKDTSYQCKICGAFALHSNFGAMTCSPCKMFFKRNAEIGQKQFKCDFDGNCEINIINRRICPFCRLTKCFANGMQIELIRGCTPKKNSIKQKKKIIKQPMMIMSTNTFVTSSNDPELPTLNLLQTDQFIVTIDQWKLFSTLMLSYDEHSSLSLAERFIFEQNILPLKLRFKSAFVNQFFSSLFTKTGFIFEQNSHFISLHSHDRSILLHHQMKYLIIITSSFILQQSPLIHYPSFNKATENLFETMIIQTRNEFLCFDILFVKLSLGMLLFSSFDYWIDEDIPMRYLINTKELINIQNMYIELGWRYLVYVYDEKQAISCFLNLIEYLLIIIDKMILLREKKDLMKMFNVIIEQTEQSFTVNRM